jgi:hypothetical protein
VPEQLQARAAISLTSRRAENVKAIGNGAAVFLAAAPSA